MYICVQYIVHVRVIIYKFICLRYSLTEHANILEWIVALAQGDIE